MANRITPEPGTSVRVFTEGPRLISFFSDRWWSIDSARCVPNEVVWGIDSFDHEAALTMQDPYLMRWEEPGIWVSHGNWGRPGCWQPVNISDNWKLRAAEAVAQAKGAPITI